MRQVSWEEIKRRNLYVSNSEDEGLFLVLLGLCGRTDFVGFFYPFYILCHQKFCDVYPVVSCH